MLIRLGLMGLSIRMSESSEDIFSILSSSFRLITKGHLLAVYSLVISN